MQMIRIAIPFVLAALLFCTAAQAEKIVVAVANSPVMSGSAVVARVSKGQVFEVLKVNGDWFRVEVQVQGSPEFGWVHKNNVRSATVPSPQKPLSSTQRQQLDSKLKILSERAAEHFAKRDFRAAAEVGRQTLTTAQALYGEEHQVTGAAYFWMAVYLDKLSLIERSLAISQKVHGKKHHRTGQAWQVLGRIAQHRGDNQNAAKAMEVALEIFEATLDPLDAETASAVLDLGSICSNLARYDHAQSYFERALRIIRAKEGEESRNAAMVLNNLAVLNERRGNLDRARQLHERVLALRRKDLGDEHPDTLSSYSNLGTTLVELGEYTQARAHFEYVLAVQRRTLGEDHRQTAQSMYNLGIVLMHLGFVEQSRDLNLKALAVRRAVLGEKHIETAFAQVNLALAQAALGDFKAARHAHEEAVAVARAALGNEHPYTAKTLQTLGEFLATQGESQAALRRFEEAREINLKVLGREHANTALSYHGTAAQRYLLGDYATAQNDSETALAINRKVRGKQHPYTAGVLIDLGILAEVQGDLDRAIHYFDQGRRAVHHHAARILPSLTTPQQMAFLQTSQSGLEGSQDIGHVLSMALRHRENQAVALHSADWLLNGKGVAQEAFAQQVRLAREDSRPEVASLLEKLATTRQELSQQTIAAPEEVQRKQHERNLAALEATEADLTQQLARLGMDVELPEGWVELQAVRGQIAESQCLVEFSRFNVYDAKTSDKTGSRYVAWIIPPAGDVAIIDLGEAVPIEAAIKAARHSIQSAVESILKEGELVAEKKTRKALRELARLILDPLMPHLGDTKEFILSPDGLLWLVPWAALPLPDGAYTVENFNIRYVVSGRDLVTGGSVAPETTAALVLADPDFNLTPNTTELTRRPADGPRMFDVSRLPGTAVEARAILPSLKKYAGQTWLYLGRDAVEAVVKQVHSPLVLSLATHGFFLPMDTHGDAIAKNPLLRCGLLLAGCNGCSLASSQNDGILTGLEIVGTDLRGTELVVLSACDTGLGDVNAGEGVAGVRQAFQLAGARSVVATLWQVPDADTAQLMSSFFAALTDTTDKSVALQQAQLARIQSRRERHGAAHPFFWAAFTLTGGE